MTDSAKIIQLRPAPAPVSPHEQLYREACWRFLDICLRRAPADYIDHAAREMREARYPGLSDMRGDQFVRVGVDNARVNRVLAALQEDA